MLLGVEGTSQGRVPGTEEGKGAMVSTWPGGQRGRVHDSERLRVPGSWEASGPGDVLF